MRHTVRWSGALVAAALVSLLPAVSGQGLGPAVDPPSFIRSAPPAARGILDTDVSIVRQRFVTLDLPLVGGAWGALPTAPALSLPLFDDVRLVASRRHAEPSRHGFVWVGTIDGQPLSQVVIAVVGGEVTGSITMPGRTYDIQPAGGGLHTVREIDDRLLLGDGEIEVRDRGVPALSATPPVDAADDASFIDVLVLYTTQVRERRGSENAALSMVDGAVAEANQAYQNSGIGQRLRLVGAKEVGYTDAADLGVDLAALRGTNDGQMDDIHALRDSLGADLVTLVVENDPKYCGMAYVLANPAAASSPSYGFSVVKRTCMSGLTYVHELGHNMGSQHDWYMTTNAGAYTYSHGHVDLDGAFRTVMAYADHCTAAGRPCTRVAYFSNPNLRYNNRPLGVAPGTNTGCSTSNTSNPPCDADNARSINNTAAAIANFRLSKFTGSAIAFPPRNETYAFRTVLETTYLTGIGRKPGPSYADVEGSVVWVSEYLLYRVHQCSHERAMEKIRTQIQGLGLPAVCGLPPGGTVPFPPRNETYAMRLELENIYKDELKRAPSQSAVDVEGDVVWVQEYLRYRLNGCSHDQATSRVLTQIGGGGIPPVCR